MINKTRQSLKLRSAHLVFPLILTGCIVQLTVKYPTMPKDLFISFFLSKPARLPFFVLVT